MPEPRNCEQIGEEPQELVVFWRLRKEDGVAEAVAWSHQSGAELRIMADERLVRSRLFSRVDDLVDYAATEQARLEARGWILTA